MAESSDDLENRDLLAAELLLGLLDGDDLATALRRRLSDRDFALTVEKWEARLAPLLDNVAEEPAPDLVWSKIEAELDRSDDGANSDRIVDDSLITRMKRWRVAAITGGTIAASLALVLVVRPSPVIVSDRAPPQQQVAPQFIAQLSGEQEGLSVVTRYDKESGQLNVTIQGLEPGQGAPVLWVVPSDGTPRALGILPTNRAGSIEISPNFSGYIDAGSMLAITIEDPKAAPFEAPTTPIVASGTISKI